MDSMADYLSKTDLSFEEKIQSIVPTTVNIIKFKKKLLVSSINTIIGISQILMDSLSKVTYW